MADLFVDARLGETRAAIVEDGQLVSMHISRDGDGVIAGTRLAARLAKKLGGRGIADLGGEEAVIEPWPAGVAEGTSVTVEVTRAAWREPGRDRLAKVRPTPLGARPAPTLAERLRAAGHQHRQGWPEDIAEQWNVAFETAELGRQPIDGGSLVWVPTPAFIAVDVDGAAQALAGSALAAIARSIRMWGLGGSVVIDLPGGPDKATRAAAATAFDSAMAGIAFERTAINGFGTLQVVLPRPGPSILERAQLERAATAALALLDAAAREPRPGALKLVARPDIARWLQARPHLLAALGRKAGRPVDVAADAMAGSGHVETA